MVLEGSRCLACLVVVLQHRLRWDRWKYVCLCVEREEKDTHTHTRTDFLEEEAVGSHA